jgi:hypothetical protein
MKRAFWVAFLAVVLLGAFALAPQSALAWGPCNGPYGGYAGCSMSGSYGGYSGGYNGGYSGGYYGGYSYNRVCYWAYYWYYPRLVCSYVRVPQYPASGYYGYSSPSYGYGMYGGY